MCITLNLKLQIPKRVVEIDVPGRLESIESGSTDYSDHQK